MTWNTPSKHTIVLDTDGDTVVEQYSNAVETIETDHAHIHAGDGYQLSGEISALAAGASYYFYMDPATPLHWRHYKISADGAPVDIRVLENPTYTAASGTTLTPLNRNRISSNTSGSTFKSNATITADGSELYISRIVGSGTGSNTTGEIEGIAVEWILDGGNTYAIKVTNNDNGALDIVYQFFWYEL